MPLELGKLWIKEQRLFTVVFVRFRLLICVDAQSSVLICLRLDRFPSRFASVQSSKVCLQAAVAASINLFFSLLFFLLFSSFLLPPLSVILGKREANKL